MASVSQSSDHTVPIRRAVRVSVAVLLAGAVYLAITRADALLIDVSALVSCL